MVDVQGIPELPRQTLEAPAFNQAKIRIEKSQRIGLDLKPQDGGAYSRERVDEVRNIEMKSTQGPEAKRGGLEEIVVDTRGYQERRSKMTYRSEGDGEVSEELVMFSKLGADGRPEWLTLEGQPLALNASLYEARLNSGNHVSGADYKASMMPRIDGRGAYTGVVSLIESGKPIDMEATQVRSNDEISSQLKVSQPDKPDQARAVLGQLAGNEAPVDREVELQPILAKIKAAGLRGRLGIEVQFTPAELLKVDTLLSEAKARLESTQEMSELRSVIDRNRGNAGFDIALGFGSAVVEDNAVNVPTVIQTKAGPQIKVPSRMFRLFRLKSRVISAQYLLEQYQSKPLEPGNAAYGTSAGAFGELIQAGLEV